MNLASLNICVQVSTSTYVFISLGHIPRSRVVGSQNKWNLTNLPLVQSRMIIGCKHLIFLIQMWTPTESCHSHSQLQPTRPSPVGAARELQKCAGGRRRPCGDQPHRYSGGPRSRAHELHWNIQGGKGLETLGKANENMYQYTTRTWRRVSLSLLFQKNTLLQWNQNLRVAEALGNRASNEQIRKLRLEGVMWFTQDHSISNQKLFIFISSSKLILLYTTL